MKKNELENVVVPKGTLIHLNGIPFELPEDTTVLGLESNLELALNWKLGFGQPTKDFDKAN